VLWVNTAKLHRRLPELVYLLDHEGMEGLVDVLKLGHGRINLGNLLQSSDRLFERLRRLLNWLYRFEVDPRLWLLRSFLDHLVSIRQRELEVLGDTKLLKGNFEFVL